MHDLVRALRGKPQEALTHEQLEQRLYGGGMVPDPGVVFLALELRCEFIRSGRIPNIAFVGEAGIGKSTLVIKLAKAVFGKKVLTNAPSDLKAPYVGQTKYETLVRLIKAAADDAVFFLDEAYTLMQDSFGREAVSLLLPLMTGDQSVKTLDAHLSNASISINFETGKVTGDLYDSHGNSITKVNPGVPPIWIAGYEDEIRLMLRQNQGLYRRFTKIVQTSPTVDKLYSICCAKAWRTSLTGLSGRTMGSSS